MSKYFENLCKAMEMVSTHPRSIFMGQAVACKGTAMTNTFRDVPKEKFLEMPVTEDMQMGMAIGMSLNGDLPICCYPRINFLLLAINQLVLHLDKIPLYSKYRPKVIIRTGIAVSTPMDPGPQHLGDFTDVFRGMLKTVYVEKLDKAEDILPAYVDALGADHSTLLIEQLGMYE